MRGTNGTKALHVATFSGWYRFEQNGSEFIQTKRDLSYWTLTCMTVDPEDPQTLYAGTEHSGLFFTNDAGAHWQALAYPRLPAYSRCYDVAVDPKDAQHLWVAAQARAWSRSASLAAAPDGGSCTREAGALDAVRMPLIREIRGLVGPSQTSG